MKPEDRRYDVAERSFQFALAVRKCVSSHRWSRVQWTDVNQLLRSSGSIAANYIEAGDVASKQDSRQFLAIAKREAAESLLWLELLEETSFTEDLREKLRSLEEEADQLTEILTTLLRGETD